MSSNKRMIDWLEAKRKADELADADGDSDRVTEAYEDVDDKMELLTQSLENTDSGFLGDDDDILHAAKLGRYIKLAQQQLPLDGAELELNTELGIESRGTEGGVLIPMILLGPRNRREHERLQAKMQEKLADVATTITSGDFQTTLRDSIKPVFAASDTAFLGIPIYGVSPGQDRIPIISSVPDPAMLGKGDDQEAVAATITSVKFNPRRLQSTILYNSVDAKFNWTPNMEAELTQALVAKSPNPWTHKCSTETEPATIRSASMPASRETNCRLTRPAKHRSLHTRRQYPRKSKASTRRVKTRSDSW